MNKLTIIKPLCEALTQNNRLEMILEPILVELRSSDAEIEIIDRVSELDGQDLRGRRIILAVSLSAAGVNIECYRLLEYLRANGGCLEGCIGGIIIDGQSDLYTKSLARQLAFAANEAGCTFPGKPLVEATGSLSNFKVLGMLMGLELLDTYAEMVRQLVYKVLDYEAPRPSGPLKLAVIHASSSNTSNTLLLWNKVRSSILRLEPATDIREISLRNGTVWDCRGCSYDECIHFGEQGHCFYGGIMVDQVFPAIIGCDILVMICPNYNDAVSANLTAFINRLTAIFRTNDFTSKRIHAIVVSGYSGGDIVSEQILGAINFNKNFILPGHFAMVETAHDPKSILDVADIDAKAEAFARHMLGFGRDADSLSRGE